MKKLITDDITNLVYFSSWIKDFPCHKSILEKLEANQVKYDFLTDTKDYWVRDFMPIQVSDQEFVSYIYKPDYLAKSPQYLTNPEDCCQSIRIKSRPIDLIIDGGNIIKCSDAIIMTDKVFVENPHLSKNEIIQRLKRVFGCSVIFIPWDKYEKYGHADGMVRHIEGKKVLLNNYCNFDSGLREKLIKALSPHFEILELDFDTNKPSAQSWAYINYLRVKDLILLPMLNIPEDKDALSQFQEIFPMCQIEQVDVSTIVKKGGALNCITWNIKR